VATKQISSAMLDLILALKSLRELSIHKARGGRVCIAQGVRGLLLRPRQRAT